MPDQPSVATLGQLRASGWVSRPVKEEIRRNAVARIRAGEALFPRVLGYEDTVLPQLENALLAGHDVIFLGERGQAKTRMIRSLTGLLDEWMPIVAGSEINDDPYNPVSGHARDLVAEQGDDTPIAWVHRDERFGEKLATPDTSIADLIGEVDPIKVAEGRYLSDELTLHYGLVPRTNRGIFAINELPDLAERIQVGLLNVLEERDVQVRGYKIRLPARPHAVRLGQPRGLHQPRPHHHPAEGPLRRPDPHPLPARGRHRGRHRPAGGHAAGRRGRRRRGARRSWPRSWPRSATWPARARTSTSARACRCASPCRTSRRSSPTRPGARCCTARPTSCPGSATSRRWPRRPPARSRSSRSRRAATSRSSSTSCGPPCSRCSRTTSPSRTCATCSTPSTTQAIVSAGEDVASADYVRLVESMPAAAPAGQPARRRRAPSPAATASAVEFVLEGLHLSKRLNKEAVGARAQYRSR